MQRLVKALSPIATSRVFKKGSVVLYQGEAPRMAYVIKSGTIKVYTINNAGDEQIVTFHGPNDIFPSPWIFNKTSVAQYYYETAAQCEILTVPREVLHGHMQTPGLMPAVLDYFVTNYSGLLMRVTALEQSRASEKIMITMYYLLFRYGSQTKPGFYTIGLPLTHNTIASLVGLTRETTTTELNRLKRQGVLQYAHRTYTINKQKLERLFGEDSFKDLTITPSA